MTSFLEKWSAKKSEKPKAGTRSAVDAFRARVTEQKAYLAEFETDAAGFNKWRSTWFQRAPGGFGVTIGRDSIDAGQGLNYVVVETTAQVAEFLDDLARHADNDVSFQNALEDNRLRRAALLNGAKAKTSTKAAARMPASVKSMEAGPVSGGTAAGSPKRGRKPKAKA